MLLDEFSGRSPEELTRTGYALANGRDKERLGTTGKFSTVGGQWFKNSFITSNDSIHESISKLPAGYRVEATQLRFFEVQLPKNYRTKTFPDITQRFIENHMDRVYGAPFRVYIRHIMQNHDQVCRKLVAARQKFNPESDEDNRERFYRDTITTAVVAGKIAKRLGLVSFDLEAMQDWALAHVVKMRESRRETNMDFGDYIAQFIASLQGRLITTKYFGDGRATKEVPMELLRGPAIGRVCTEDKKVFVTCKAVSDFCKEHNIPPSSMRDEMDKRSYLARSMNTATSVLVRIGTGTTIPSTASRCYELNYRKLFDGASLSVVEPDAQQEEAV